MWTNTQQFQLQDTVLFGTVIYSTLYKNWFENMRFVFWLDQYSIQHFWAFQNKTTENIIWITYSFTGVHTETMFQNSYTGFNLNQGKPVGVLHCCASVCFCFNFWRNCTLQTIALILLVTVSVCSRCALQLDNIMFNTLSTFHLFYWNMSSITYIGTREYHHGKTVLVSTYVFINI